jgi:hypothetical protein
MVFLNYIFSNYFLSSKRLLLHFASIGILCGSIGLIISFYARPVYKANCNFIVKESSINSLSSTFGNFSSILGNNNFSQLDRYAAILNSERIIRPVLFTKISILGVNDLVINHFIRLHNIKFNDQKLTNLALYNFFESDSSIDNLSYEKLKIYSEVLSTLKKKKRVFDISTQSKSGIISLDVYSYNPDFAKYLNLLILREMKKYIFDQVNLSSNLNIVSLSQKVDSIQQELAITRTRMAKNIDQSYGVLLNEDKIEGKALSIKEQILLTMYGEAQKNLETMQFISKSNSNSTSFIILDSPFEATKIKKNILIYTFGFFIIGLCIGFLYLVIKRFK